MQRFAHRNAKSAAPEADDLLARAHRQWEKGQLRSAFRLFLAAAKRGDVTAQLDLGYFYDTGIGIRPNRSASLQWYKRAYRQGHGSAASNIATIFRDEGDARQAIAWFKRAVRLGDIDANLEIAKVFLQDKKRAADAVPYLKRVAAAKPKVDVTEASKEEAERFLKTLSLAETRSKAQPRRRTATCWR
jgi:TPR repeat protein